MADDEVLLWGTGERTRLYLQVICPNCAGQISITGTVEHGAIVAEDCPVCGSPFAIHIRAGQEEAEEDEVSPFIASADVTWRLEHGYFPLCSMKIRPDSDPVSVMFGVVTSGIGFFAGTTMSPVVLATEIARRLCVSCIDDENLERLGLMIADILKQRKAGPRLVKKNGGGNGHDKDGAADIQRSMRFITRTSEEEDEQT